MATTLIGTQLKETRKLLLNLLQAKGLVARRTYYDYYDSCHAPVETPDAPWSEASDVLGDKLNSGSGFSLSYKGNGVFSLWTGYCTYELKRRSA